MLKIILPAPSFTSKFNIVYFGTCKLIESDNIKDVKSSSEKVKNLLKTKNNKKLAKSKNVKKFAKSKKSAKTIANKACKTNFFIPKVRVLFT